MPGRIWIGPWANSSLTSIVSVCLACPIQTNHPVLKKVEREIKVARKVATPRVVATRATQCINPSQHPGITTWATTTLL
jgi:hypothetical protein